MRVLIVDDGKAGDDLAHHLRALYGAETFRALSLADGLAKRLEITDLDFIVLDLSFPDSKRDDTIDCIGAFKQTAPVFVYTGYEEQELLQKSLDAGALDWFLKSDTERGASTLASRMASTFYRTRKDNGGRAAGERIITPLFQDRRQLARAPVDMVRDEHWLRSNVTIIALILAFLGQAIGFGMWAWNLSAANALFRKQVEDNTRWIAGAEPRLQAGKENDAKSELERQELKRRMDIEEAKIETIRKEVSDGVKDLYQLMLSIGSKNTSRSPNNPHN